MAALISFAVAKLQLRQAFTDLLQAISSAVENNGVLGYNMREIWNTLNKMEPNIREIDEYDSESGRLKDIQGLIDLMEEGVKLLKQCQKIGVSNFPMRIIHNLRFQARLAKCVDVHLQIQIAATVRETMDIPQQGAAAPTEALEVGKRHDMNKKYGVFLSYRGEDTHSNSNFVCHLYMSLLKKGILTLVDNEDFQKGDVSIILDEIQESNVLVVILSESYAKSARCLEALAKIMECRKTQGQKVLPVFYRVGPSDVESQTGIFGVAFEEHKKNKNNIAETLQCWRNALIEVANLKGCQVPETSFEEQAIEEIVTDISMYLRKRETTSSSARPRSFEFDVFLNFRGDDVRYGFLYNLKEALEEKEIKTFYDAEDLRKSEDIATILKKIEVSKMSIMVFSKDYASSAYCLEELVKILECKKRWDHKALPVFYHVPPSVVANQSGIYDEALQKHENEKATNSKEVSTWRASLQEAAAISAFLLENQRPEKHDIRDIVEAVRKILEEFDKEQIP